MAPRARRSGGNGLDAWPGYVDALSTLLMVIIFVLLVFVLAQAFLSVALSRSGDELTRLNQRIASLSDELGLEQGRTADLKQSLSSISQELAAAGSARATLAAELAALKETDRRTAGERDQLAAQLGARSADATHLADTRRELTVAQAELAAMKRAIAERDQTVQTDRATLEAKLSDLANLNEQVRALTALRDELEAKAADAAARATTEAERRAAVEALLADEKKLGDSGRAEVALLNRQLGELRTQLASLTADLDTATVAGRDKDTQIANLGEKLNTALAAKVEELQRYRSEFFGRLRAVLANRPGIQVVGDRFVFQSEVLFPSGSAELSRAGQDQARTLATTIKQIAGEIPSGIPWVLRVDGHADRQRVTNGIYPTNWELSTARAISVVKLLIAEGVPAEHLAAAGFGEFSPIDPADSPDAYAKNRRIELRLTDR